MSTRSRFSLKLGLLLLPGLVATAIWLLLAPAALAQMPMDHGIVCTDGPTFNLTATEGHITIPDGNSLLMWSFSPSTGMGTQAIGANFQFPSAVLCVHQGDQVTVALTNDLPESTSIVFPGQTNVQAVGGVQGLFARQIHPGGTITYTFTADEPGTYLYESGTSKEKQVQMGLFGALIVRPGLGDQYAYNDPATQFQQEYLMLLHDIDHNLHQAVERGEPYDVTTMHADYFTINGRAAPDTDAPNHAQHLPKQPYSALVALEYGQAVPALIRYLNAGQVDHPFHPHGDFSRIIGRDGRSLIGGGVDLSVNSFTIDIGSGETVDCLFLWTDRDGWEPNTNPIPVTIPDLQNLAYHLNMTTYGGTPYIGVEGDLPVGVLRMNMCGEYYFPWHSHALNEMQNWDQGMAGMFVHLRVDPPGGCMP